MFERQLSARASNPPRPGARIMAMLVRGEVKAVAVSARLCPDAASDAIGCVLRKLSNCYCEIPMVLAIGRPDSVTAEWLDRHWVTMVEKAILPTTVGWDSGAASVSAAAATVTSALMAQPARPMAA